MRKKTFMTLLGLALVVPFSSCNIAPTDSGEASKTTVSPSESGSSYEEEEYSYFYENTSKSYRRFSDRQLGPDSSKSSSSPLLNVSEPDGTNDKLTFTLNTDQKSYTVSAKNNVGDYGAVVIPPSYKGKPVTAIRYGAFSNKNTLTRVYVPHTILAIGEVAFSACHDLVTIEVSAYNPNFASFDYCLYNKNLTELIAFPAGRKTLSFPGNLTTIKERAFSLCDVSRINNWPDSITTIENQAFMDATTGSSFTLPKNVITIGEEAFKNCAFSQVTLGNKVIEIGDSAFKSTGLATIEFPSSVREIGVESFAECKSLENVKIRSGLAIIGSRAFAEDTHLADVNFPDTLMSLPSNAFEGCYATKKFVVAAQNPYYASQNYVVYDKAFTKVIKCPATKANVTLPNTVTDIGDLAFEHCSNIQSITIHNVVTSIGKSAFIYCYSLSSVTLGTGVLNIRENAFRGCSALTNVSVNSQILRIEAYAFASSALSSFDFPKSISIIGENAFKNTNLREVFIPDAATLIGDNAFGSCDSLRTLYLGSGLNYIGRGAFSNCNRLATISYGGTVAEWRSVTIDKNAFSGIATTIVACCDGNAAL
ncbi:MAG: leucine-rich repeat domain-containing protein [Bacilli bacterium]|nr:leucine-rich repeat domain-containing protein [Bacilli bacterium]